VSDLSGRGVEAGNTGYEPCLYEKCVHQMGDNSGRSHVIFTNRPPYVTGDATELDLEIARRINDVDAVREKVASTE
jgi:hypothetical protein